MCTYCEQHCVEDEPWRLSRKEIRSGKRLPENICPDKQDDDEYESDAKPAKVYYKVESYNGLPVIDSSKPIYKDDSS